MKSMLNTCLRDLLGDLECQHHSREGWGSIVDQLGKAHDLACSLRGLASVVSETADVGSETSDGTVEQHCLCGKCLTCIGTCEVSPMELAKRVAGLEANYEHAIPRIDRAIDDVGRTIRESVGQGPSDRSLGDVQRELLAGLIRIDGQVYALQGEVDALKGEPAEVDSPDAAAQSESPGDAPDSIKVPDLAYGHREGGVINIDVEAFCGCCRRSFRDRIDIAAAPAIPPASTDPLTAGEALRRIDNMKRAMKQCDEERNRLRCEVRTYGRRLYDAARGVGDQTERAVGQPLDVRIAGRTFLVDPLGTIDESSVVPVVEASIVLEPEAETG